MEIFTMCIEFRRLCAKCGEYPSFGVGSRPDTPPSLSHKGSRRTGHHRSEARLSERTRRQHKARRLTPPSSNSVSQDKDADLVDSETTRVRRRALSQTSPGTGFEGGDISEDEVNDLRRRLAAAEAENKRLKADRLLVDDIDQLEKEMDQLKSRNEPLEKPSFELHIPRAAAGLDGLRKPRLFNRREEQYPADFRAAGLDAGTAENMDTSISARFIGPPAHAREVGLALAWLASVFRHVAPDRDLQKSTATFVEKSDYFIGPDNIYGRITCDPLTTFESPRRKGNCWSSLFKGSTIAWGFPTATQRHLPDPLMGIEMSFELMLKMTGAIYPIEFDNRVIFRGNDKVLVPTASSGSFVQWHLLLPSNPGSFNLRALLETMYPDERNKLDDMDWGQIMTMHHCLGYCPEAEIVYGSPNAPLGSVQTSSAIPEKTSIRLQGFEVAKSLELFLAPAWA
ncbi:MAG: hypothetical protein Q9159_003879 [Coniocarpon cinnabarinum]